MPRATWCLAAVATTWLAATVAAHDRPRARTAQPGPQAVAPSAPVPTFAKDVAPILYAHCTSCHRPGEIGPMSLLTYDDARDSAKNISQQVRAGHMPPWQAVAPPGTFQNERRLDDREKATLLTWAEGGAPEGDPKDVPAPPVYADGWQIGKPDVVFQADSFNVPATGALGYQHFFIQTDWNTPKWIKAVEIRPGNRRVVHHILAYYRATPDEQRTPLMSPIDPRDSIIPPPPTHTPLVQNPDRPGPKRLLGSYAPGCNPQVMPEGTALRLEPGGVIELEVHYTTTGAAATDRSSIGLVFSKDPAPREVLASAFIDAAFKLPAGDPNVRVSTGVVFLQDVTVWGLFPHAHLRGKRWLDEVDLPDGTTRTVLDIPHYDCNWQTFYIFKTPLQLPAGSRLRATAWFDNSVGNMMNPDPTVDVTWGEQVWDEMQYTGVLLAPAKAAPPIKR